MVHFAKAATTALLWHRSLILHALYSEVQVRNMCSTVFISLKLMRLALCRCWTVGLKSWAGVRILDGVCRSLRK
jgi:hypothetical protein